METQYAPNTKKAHSQFTRYLNNPRHWNRYPYSLNNPLFYTDPNGEDVTIYYRPAREGGGSMADFGHILIYVKNDETGESAYFDYYPDSELTVVGNVDQSRIDAHASLTIETTSEQEQAILDGVKAISQSAPNYDPPGLSHNTFGGESTCVTQSENLLRKGGINLDSRTPAGLWEQAVNAYGAEKPKNWPSAGNPRTYIPGRSRAGGEDSSMNPKVGREYGHDPRGQGRKWDPSAVNAKTKTFFQDGKIVKRDQY
jgi:hypothetical protein